MLSHYLKTIGVPEIFTNCFIDQTQEVLEILSSYFKTKNKGPDYFKLLQKSGTKGPRKSFKLHVYLRNKTQGSPRFFQITSKFKHKVSQRFFQTTYFINQASKARDSSNYFKNNTRNPREFFKLLQKLDTKARDSFKLLQNKTQGTLIISNYVLQKPDAKGPREFLDYFKNKRTSILSNYFKKKMKGT